MKNFTSLPAVLCALLVAFSLPVGRAATVIDALADTHPDFHVTVTGQGRPVLLIPGLATPGDIWQPTVDALKATCQCHILSLAGFGSVKPTGTDPFLSHVRDEVIDYIRENKLDHPVIVGHSLGGTLALWIATTAPELPGRLVIVDAVPFMGAFMDPAATLESARAAVAPMAEQISNASPAAFALIQETMIPQWVSSPEQARRVAAETSKSDAKTVGRALNEVMSIDLRADLAKIICPALVLGALADKTLSAPKEQVIDSYHKQYAALRGVRFEMFDRAKHFIMVDDPAGFMKALEGELAAR